MKKIAAAAAVLFALVTAGSAGAALKVGVAEDTTGYLDGGAAIFNQMHGTGMSVVRMTVIWDENQPTTIQGQGALAQSRLHTSVQSALHICERPPPAFQSMSPPS